MIRRRTFFERLRSVPYTFRAHYRIMRRSSSRWVALRVALQFSLLLIRGIV